jgi:SAM-dependent methyltransferase
VVVPHRGLGAGLAQPLRRALSQAERRRSRVARAYARAILAPPAPAGGEPGPPSRLPGYRFWEVARLPPEALTCSFGCGHPVAAAGLRDGEAVLDVGCGAGVDLILAALAVGPAGRVVGVDLTPEMVARARSNAAAAGLANVEVHAGLMEALPVDAGSMDCVISNGALSLSPEKPRALAEMARVLAPHGRAAVSDLVVDALPEWARAAPALEASCLAGALAEGALLDGFRRAGLAEAEVVARVVLDAGEVETLLRAELEAAEPPAPELLARARELVGRVASLTVVARRPR